MKKLNKKGFTLIELLAVIVILAVLSLIAIPAVRSTINKARYNTFITQGKTYIEGAQNIIAASTDYDESNAYCINISSIKLDRGQQKSPFGNKTLNGYVIVTAATSLADPTWTAYIDDGTHKQTITPTTEKYNKNEDGTKTTSGSRIAYSACPATIGEGASAVTLTQLDGDGNAVTTTNQG